jgi:hypothetical protein
MRFMNRLLMGIGAVALAGTLLSLVGPKAVHAAVAALVLVTNTPANPVPNADVNAPGEEPFQTQFCLTTPSTDACGSTPSGFVVPTTTSDGLSIKRLVIEQISASCSETGTITSLQAYLSFQMNENQVNGSAFPGTIYLPFTPTPGNLGAKNPVSTVAVRAYADPGTAVSNYQQWTSGTSLPASLMCNYTVVGHFVTH